MQAEFEILKEFEGIKDILVVLDGQTKSIIQRIVLDTAALLESVEQMVTSDDDKTKVALKARVENAISFDPKKDTNKVTALHIFAAYGLTAAAKRFLELGANPTLAMKTNEGELLTPLMLAARYGHHEIVEIILQQTPAAKVISQQAIFELSAMKQDEKLAGVVFENNVSPLHIFCALGYVEQFKKLLLASPNRTNLMTGPNGAQFSPVMLAAFFKHLKIVKLLLKGAGLPYSKELHDVREALTLLEIAAHNEDTALIDFLLNTKKLDPNVRYHELNKTALYWAASKNNADLCEKLLFAGANPDLVMAGQNEDDLVTAINVSDNPEIRSLLLAFSKQEGLPLEHRIAQHVCSAMQACNTTREKEAQKELEYNRGVALLKAVLTAKDEEKLHVVVDHFMKLPTAVIKGFDFSNFEQFLALNFIKDKDLCQILNIKPESFGKFSDRKPRIQFVDAVKAYRNKPVQEASAEVAVPEAPRLLDEVQAEKADANAEKNVQNSNIAEPDMAPVSLVEEQEQPKDQAPSSPNFLTKGYRAIISKLNKSNTQESGPPLVASTEISSNVGDADETAVTTATPVAVVRAAPALMQPVDEHTLVVATAVAEESDSDSEKDRVDSYGY